MSGSQFQQFNAYLNKMLGSTLKIIPNVPWGRHISGGAGSSTHVSKPVEAESPAKVLRSWVSTLVTPLH